MRGALVAMAAVLGACGAGAERPEATVPLTCRDVTLAQPFGDHADVVVSDLAGGRGSCILHVAGGNVAVLGPLDYESRCPGRPVAVVVAVDGDEWEVDRGRTADVDDADCLVRR